MNNPYENDPEIRKFIESLTGLDGLGKSHRRREKMKEIIQSYLDLIEDLSVVKVDIMTAIAHRNGFSEELDQMIQIDNQIYMVVGKAKKILDSWK